MPEPTRVRTSPSRGEAHTSKLARGVYLENYLSDGARPILVAVDDRGRRVAWAVLPDPGAQGEVTALLHTILVLAEEDSDA